MARLPSPGLGLVVVAAIALVACGSSGTIPGSPSGSPAASVTPSAESASAGVASGRVPTPYPTTATFTSPLYGYSVTVGAGWQVIPATIRWNGKTTIAHEAPDVDQILPPKVTNRCSTVFRCAPLEWAASAPTDGSLPSVVADMDAAEARDHPCPAKTESEEPATIDGEPASIGTKHCPADGGILVLRAVAVHEGVAYYFWLQDQANERAVDPVDRADFDAFVRAIDLP